MKNNLSKTPVVVFLAMICCLLWGSAFSCIKVGYKIFNIASTETGSQILFAGTRFALAGIMVIITFSIMQKKFIKPSHPEKIFVLSLTQTSIQYLFFYIGLAYSTGVKSSIITGSGTFITILVASLIFHQEKLTANKVIGSIIGFAGVLIVNLSGKTLQLDFNLMGDGFILLSALSSAFSSAFIKKFSKTANVVMLSGYQFFTGGCMMVVVGLVMGGKLNMSTWTGIPLLAYMAFISAAAYTIWSILLKYNDVSKVSVYKFMNPIFGCVISYIVLNEATAMGYQMLIALILVCAGIFIAQRARGSK